MSSVRVVSRSLAFLVLRDGQGFTQIKVEMDGRDTIVDYIRSIPVESVVHVKGRVVRRPSRDARGRGDTGEIEVSGYELRVLNRVEDLPIFYNRTEINVESEELKQRYRYLELRQSYMQKNLRVRSEVMRIICNFLVEKGYCEIETPTLFKRTPEGAGEYIVPSRLPGRFYSLVQSPQQYKQLLMISGFEKYFQIARCYRNEDLRSDRQPEFTQIDIESIFVTQLDIMGLIEKLIFRIWKEILNIELEIPFRVYAYEWCMETYGTDRPDMRFGVKIVDLKYIFDTANTINMDGGAVKAINLKRLSDGEFRRLMEAVSNCTKEEFLIDVLKYGSGGSELGGRFGESAIGSELKGRFDESAIGSELKDAMGVEDGDVVVIAHGKSQYSYEILKMLGKLRIWYRDEILLVDDEKKVGLLNAFEIFWVVDFPLFIRDGDKRLKSAHHPFTAPHADDVELLRIAPEKVRGQSYDIVINGNEVGGGSIRIHSKQDQIYILKNILKLHEGELKELSHLTNALGHGCPPHGGIALGLDRLLMAITNSNSIKNVIAFPKSNHGIEVMTNSPSKLGDVDIKFLLNHINSL